MSTATFTSEDRRPALPPLGSPRPSRSGRGGDDAWFSRQLAVVPGMLATLDTLTIAGQRDVMSKVVGFIEDHAECAARGLGPRNARTFADLLGHLTHESQRLVPDVRAFVERAGLLLALLAATE